MLAHDDLASLFVGGTIYQAFLSALSYHRWHCPVSSTIEKIHFEDGTYYAENFYEGFVKPTGPDPAAPDKSQSYITQVAARPLVYIKADNPDIDLICAVFVGVAEVFSCEIFKCEGDHIEKGEELGTFHFGGATHCLLSQPKVNLKFVPTPPFKNVNLRVNSTLAIVKKQ